MKINNLKLFKVIDHNILLILRENFNKDILIDYKCVNLHKQN